MALQEDQEAGGAPATSDIVIKIPVPKAGKGVFIEVALTELADNTYLEVLLQGAKVLANRKMADVKTQGLEGDELAKAQAIALEIAEKNVEDMKSGNIKRSAAGKSKVTGKVMTQAMQIARQLVKDQLKRENIRVSDVDAKEITAAAKELIEENPEILGEAERLVAEKEEKLSGIKFTAKGKVKVNTEKKRKNDEKLELARAATAAKATGTKRKKGAALNA